MNQLPETGFLRLPQIIGDPKRGIPPLVPVSKSTWWQGVHEGRFPRARKLSHKVTVWCVEDIRALILEA
jgi:predicted DNA-binding transcriptional regulator AlpA